MALFRTTLLALLCASTALTSESFGQIIHPPGGGGGTGSGSLKYFVAPDTNNVPVTNSSVSRLEMANGANIILSHLKLGSNSTVVISAVGSVPGPQGAAGFGNVHYYGVWSSNLVVTTQYSMVSYGGSVYLSSNAAFSAVTPPYLDSRWIEWISSGADGADGADGLDGIGLRFQGDWNILNSITTNDIIARQNVLYVPKTDLASPPDPLTSPTNYTVLLSGTTGSVVGISLTNMTFGGAWSYQAYPSNIVVAFGGLLYYSASAVTCSPCAIPPSSPWAVAVSNGVNGINGSDGADGVGLTYDDFWQAYKVYPSNTLVSRTVGGKPNVYRSVTVNSGRQPELYPADWATWLSSGLDAEIVALRYYSSYDGAVTYSNALIRVGDTVYKTKDGVSVSGVSPPNASYFETFVRDGTALSTNPVWRGSWQSGAYVSNDFVTYLGSLWLVTQGTTEATPGGTNWLQWVSKGADGATGPMGPPGTSVVINVTNITQITYLTQNVYNVTNSFTGTNFISVTNVYITNFVNNYTNTINILNTTNITYVTNQIIEYSVSTNYFITTNDMPSGIATNLQLTNRSLFGATVDTNGTVLLSLVGSYDEIASPSLLSLDSTSFLWRIVNTGVGTTSSSYRVSFRYQPFQP